MKQINITILFEDGLHARPAANFISLITPLKSNITINKKNDNNIYAAKSIISVLSMGAIKGDKLSITIEGEDEDFAAQIITDFFNI